MKIYISHSRAFNFAEELYKPLKESGLLATHQFIFPHETSNEPYPSKQLFLTKGCDLVLAEVSYPSTGQGIELGWADASGIKIICLHTAGSKISGSLKEVTKDFLVYKHPADLIEQLSNYLK